VVSGRSGTAANRFLLRASCILTPFEEIRDGAILTSGPTISSVGPLHSIEVPAGTTILEFGDATLIPGMVDVHIHGSGGFNAMDGAEAIRRVGEFIASRGVTAWLPTLTSMSTIRESADVIRACVEGARQDSAGAEAVGIHLEGPFLSPKRPGAIRPEWFRAPSLDDLRALLDAGSGWVRLMTLAPELPGGIDLVRALVASGVTPSIGHSDATYSEAVTAIDAGVRHATHAYNAMRGLHQREPGVLGAVLCADKVRAELIGDGIHVLPAAMSIVIRAKGAMRVALITDAIAAAGLCEGSYEFDGRPITVASGKATLADGTIAGSIGRADDNLRRIVCECGFSLRDAVLMASTVPARAAGVGDRKGSLAGGKDADVVALDQELRVRFTMARGRIVYDAGS
jgi:N-acetylglucosamine-6-phosphate deacetylase